MVDQCLWYPLTLRGSVGPERVQSPHWAAAVGVGPARCGVRGLGPSTAPRSHAGLRTVILGRPQSGWPQPGVGATVARSSGHGSWRLALQMCSVGDIFHVEGVR